MNYLDLKIYGAVLRLLRFRADVNVDLISEVSGVSKATIYRRIGNYYLIENEIKRKERQWRKKKK